MPDIRIAAAATLSTVVIVGTAYSVIYGTYLDTSNPILTRLPHPLSKTHYWASKRNFLNVYFIKYAWGWTSAAFLALWATSPPSARTTSRMVKWAAQTCAWLVFTSWFFGPALIERFVVASGGACYVTLPSGDVMTVPQELCYARRPVSLAEHAELFASSDTSSFAIPLEWRGHPRLRKGHDISGHIFLVVMAALFLIDQLRVSLRRQAEPWSLAHTLAVWGNVVLIGLWLVACCTTSVYFHTPFEKMTGLLLGLASFGITQVPSYLRASARSATAPKSHTN